MNKKQSQSGFAHLVIIIVLVVALVGALGFVYWQNFMQPKASDTSGATTAALANKFTESLDKFTAKTLIGSNNNYEVYILGVHNGNETFASGNVLVYSKSLGKAFEINKTISVFEEGVSGDNTTQYGDSYLVVDNGTSVQRNNYVILLSSGDVIEVVAAVNSVGYWKDHYIYTGSDTSYSRDYESGESNSIFSLDLLTKITTKIVGSTVDNDYFVNSITGDTLNYTEYPASSVGNGNGNILTLDLNTIK